MIREGNGQYIIGWFDILGFKKMLSNASIEYLNQEIVPRFEDLRENIIGKILDKEAQHADVKAELNKVDMLVISDTLAVICPLSTPARPSWLAFLEYARTLSVSMFEVGLPVRGAVTVGNVCVRSWGLFGAPVVRAHEACEDLEIAASVFLPDAVDAMYLASGDQETQASHVFYAGWYDIPYKSIGATRLSLVQLLNYGYLSTIKGSEIHSYIINKFGLHSKSINDPSIKAKIDNTTAFFQWNRWQWKHGDLANQFIELRQSASSDARRGCK